MARTHEHLKASVDSMRNGLAIWSADDRLVLANSAYKNFFPSIKELIVKGARFEDIQLAAYDKGTWSVSDKNRQAWLDQQLEKRRTTRQWEYELVLADGKPLVFDESLLDNDEVITTIVDISSHRDRELELKNTKSELEQIAYFDNLTGLGNRAHCQKDLAEKYAFLTPGSKFAIIIIDLDKFKRVNDTLGHAAGDHLLKTIGQRFKQFSAELNGIEVYRWGGDEFIALLDRSENTDIGSICEELTDIGSVPLSFDDKILRPTVSLGVARYPEDGEDLQALMIFSDLALYKTKELGRDGYQFFTSDMKATIDRETRIEDELWVAIEKGQLELYYQPQISAKDESITGFEALLRWNHPERGLIPPGDFLPISEVTGLARIIGCHVFDQAAKTIRAWLDEGIEFGRLSVNLSPQHLKESLFLADLFGALDRHNVEPHHLVVEILETFLLDDPHANVKSTLKKIREHGIEVELDDFGTGYASLSHLSSMPISGIKIDRSFIQQITTDPKQRGIVSSLISISNVMELRIVCEGIELQEQVEAISSLSNCSLQGYFIARPMTLEDTSDWIRNEQNKGLVRDFPSIQLSNAS